jgi:hypothetical protein
VDLALPAAPREARFPHRNKGELSINWQLLKWRRKMNQQVPRQIIALLGALLLIFAMGCGTARATTTTRHHVKHAAAYKKTGKHKTVMVTASRHAPQPSLAIVTKPATDAPDFDYRDRIAEAQALAQSAPVLPGDMEVVGNQLAHFTWVLVVGQKTGPLQIVRMDESGHNDQGFTITWPVDNFLNTKFHVDAPAGTIVFAQRRPVRAPGIANGYQEAVYTAYAPELDTKKMRDAGMEYLHHLQRLAYDRIKNDDVRSRVAPNSTVAEEIPTDMVLRLMITEHVDPLHMKFVGIEQCVHEVLVTIAANNGHAYAYARSSAGALGMPQFVEDSYQMVRTAYPKALLEPDFTLGMTNLGNAVTASVLLLDLELTELPKDYLKSFRDSRAKFADFLAAGYNRNPVHVVQTYHRTHTFTGGKAPVESKMYVRIQDWVGGFLKKEYAIP